MFTYGDIIRRNGGKACVMIINELDTIIIDSIVPDDIGCIIPLNILSTIHGLDEWTILSTKFDIGV